MPYLCIHKSDRSGAAAPHRTIHRGIEQLAARRAHNPEVGGSSPPPATKADNLKGLSVFCFHEFLRIIPFHVVAVLGSFGLAGKTQPVPPAMKRCSVRNSSLASSFRLRPEMFRCEKGWFRISVIGCHITEYFKHLVLRKSSINAFSLVPFDSSGIRFSSCSNIEDLHVEAGFARSVCFRSCGAREAVLRLVF